MKELKIETGLVEYNLGGKVTVEFSPTDMNFVEKARRHRGRDQRNRP